MSVREDSAEAAKPEGDIDMEAQVLEEACGENLCDGKVPEDPEAKKKFFAKVQEAVASKRASAVAAGKASTQRRTS